MEHSPRQTICQGTKQISVITKEALNNPWVTEERTRELRKYSVIENSAKTIYYIKICGTQLSRV